MKLLLLGGVLVAGLVAWRLGRRLERARVSPDWLVDCERRAWGAGVDQSALRQWPIQRRKNSQGWRNRIELHAETGAARLRKEA